MCIRDRIYIHERRRCRYVLKQGNIYGDELKTSHIENNRSLWSVVKVIRKGEWKLTRNIKKDSNTYSWKEIIEYIIVSTKMFEGQDKGSVIVCFKCKEKENHS